MKFVGVRDFRGRTAAVWAELEKEKELVITSNGKPVALLTAVNEGDLEVAMKTLRCARAMAATDAMQAQALGRGLNKLPSEAIEQEIHAARRARR